MPNFLHWSLRVRVVLVVVLATVPLMGLIWFGAQRQLVRESLDLENEVQRLTAFIAGDVNHLLETTRQILVAVAAVSTSVSPEHRSGVMAELTKHCPYYTGFVVVGPTGEVFRSETLRNAVLDPVEDDLLLRARESGTPVVGRFRAGPSGGTGFLTVASHLRKGTGGEAEVAFAVLDLGWLDSLLAEERVTGHSSLFPPGMILNILDRSGTVLTRHPDREVWTGRRFPDTSVMDEILRRGSGGAELRGVDGISRYYGFKSVGAVSGDIFVCTGVSKHAALAAARRDMYRNLAGVFVVGVILVLAAWFGTGLFIVRPLTLLMSATRRLGTGDLTVRTGITRGPSEITRLAGTFDAMAGSLEDGFREREEMRVRLVEYDRQLRSMAVETALVEERERRQIAAGLHDKVGPLLASCYMKLGLAAKRAESDVMREAIKASRELVDQTIGEVRSLTFDLSSTTLYTLGLTAAVDELCGDVARSHSLNIVFRDQGTPKDLPNDRRVVLYGAAKELLLNVVKHAEATQVTVTCGGDAEEVFLSVVDDGVGFDSTTAGHGFSRTGGFGLFNLRERMTHLGGRLDVVSARGEGTRVVVALPSSPPGAQEEQRHADEDLPRG